MNCASTVWISANNHAVSTRAQPACRLRMAASRAFALESQDAPSFAHLLPTYDTPNGIDVVTLKVSHLPIALPAPYTRLASLLQIIADRQGQDTTMPYTETAATLFIRRAFWPEGQRITDYTGHMMDADPRLARTGHQARMVNYSIHDAPGLTLGFHAVALPASRLRDIDGASLKAYTQTIQAIKDNCAEHNPDVTQQSGQIVRRDELTAWGRTNKVIGDGQHHHFITVSFYLPHQQQAATTYAQRRKLKSSPSIAPRY